MRRTLALAFVLAQGLACSSRTTGKSRPDAEPFGADGATEKGAGGRPAVGDAAGVVVSDGATADAFDGGHLDPWGGARYPAIQDCEQCSAVCTAAGWPVGVCDAAAGCICQGARCDYAEPWSVAGDRTACPVGMPCDPGGTRCFVTATDVAACGDDGVCFAGERCWRSGALAECRAKCHAGDACGCEVTNSTHEVGTCRR